MPSSEDCIQAQTDLTQRVIDYYIQKGHQKESAILIARHMSYEEKCKLFGIKSGAPYSLY